MLSQLFDKPERRKVVDFVDYMKSGQALLVPKGNPQGVSGLDSLCGRKVAAETGTTDRRPAADARARSARPPATAGITLRLFLRDSDAFQQLGLEQVDVYGTTTETVAFAQQAATGPVRGRRRAVRRDPLRHRYAQGRHGGARRRSPKAFASMQADGTYSRILAKWGLQLDELK